MKNMATMKRVERMHAMPLFTITNGRWLARIIAACCAAALMVSLFITGVDTQNTLRKACGSVAEDFTAIMRSYQHSFCLFEKLLQQEIINVGNPDAIEAFLKEQDAPLLAIEGGDYDGVYMYYQGRYLYSWDTPMSVYTSSGYDATQRPWYIGAMEAKGEVFFSTPYPSYANDYMLATISRLQPDGETVIAYDIKLGEIGRYVDKLDLFNGALTLICDNDGNIIGCTEHRYLGGNYMRSDAALKESVLLAKTDLVAAADDNAREKAEKKLQSAEALSAFCAGTRGYLAKLLQKERTLQTRLKDFSFGYAFSNGTYTCFVLAPIAKLVPKAFMLWAALSFLFLAAAICILRVVSRGNQVLTDVLTGLNNRRAFYKYCHNHMQHRPDEELYMIMLDLNDFKQINDRFGHVTGDHALLEVAVALKKTCADAPCNFFLCRYGGDEFLLAATDCTEETIAWAKAEILKNFACINATGEHPYALGVSIGTASGKCADVGDVERLLVSADEAMYHDKLRMKNQTSGVADSRGDSGSKEAPRVL